MRGFVDVVTEMNVYLLNFPSTHLPTPWCNFLSAAAAPW